MQGIACFQHRLWRFIGWWLLLGLLMACGVSEQGRAPTEALPTLYAEIQRETARAAFIASEHATMDAWSTPNPTRDAIERATYAARPTQLATPYPSNTPGPSPIPVWLRSLHGHGFLDDAQDSRFWNNRRNLYKTFWNYDVDNYTIVVAAGARVFSGRTDDARRLPEPYQGLLLVGREWHDADENLLFREEAEVELPVRDGAAQILDAHVRGDQMLLTVKTTGGSVYVFDVGQRSLSAPLPPTLDAGGPYLVAPGGSVTLAAQGQDTAGVLLDYAWDLDGDGSFETPGQEVAFVAQALPDSPSRTIAVRVTSKSGLSATAQALVQLQSSAPTTTP